MSRLPRTEPSLSEWAALGAALRDARPRLGESHGSCARPARSAASTRAPGRSRIARSPSYARPGLVEVRGRARATPARPGRRSAPRGAAGRPSGAGARRAVEHVRDLRSELMLKLLFHDRAGTRPDAAPARAGRSSSPGPSAHSSVSCASATEFDRTLPLWRLSVVRAALSFVEALLDRRTAEPVVYRPIGVVVSPHDELDGMPLQPLADASGRVADRDLRAAPRLPRPISTASPTSGSSRTSTRALGWDAVGPDLPRRPVTHGTFATRSPHRPNAIGLSLARIAAVERAAVVVDGLDLLDGTPVLDLKPYVPLFDTPAGRRALRLVRRSCRARVPPHVRRPLRAAQRSRVRRAAHAASPSSFSYITQPSAGAIPARS